MRTVLAVLGLMLAGAAIAQPPDSAAAGPPGAAQHLQFLATMLDLTDAQKTQLQQVLATERTKLQALREQWESSGTKPTREQMHSAHEQIAQETLTQLKTFLSEAQVTKFQLLMKQRMHGRWGHPPAGGAPPASSAPSTN
jgi:Spy/CpxP family protein refolding chaperone